MRTRLALAWEPAEAARGLFRPVDAGTASVVPAADEAIVPRKMTSGIPWLWLGWLARDHCISVTFYVSEKWRNRNRT